MHRRTWMKSMVQWALVAAAPMAAPAPARAAEDADTHTVLYIDYDVEPANEAAMIDVFHNRFKAAAEKQDGYIDLKILKLRPLRGAPPRTDIAYRFQLTFENEAKRRTWVASDAHKATWPLFAALIKNAQNRLGDIC